MAKSKFYPHQDKNNDGLIDVCEDIISVAEADDCPDCIPNPTAMVPDWTQKTVDDPFLNEKECLYQITVVTSYTDTGYESDMDEDEADAALEAIRDQYVEKAIENLLSVYDKEDTEGTRRTMRESLEKTDYQLLPRQSSRLKLLYSIPFEVLNSIDDAGEESEEEDAGTSPIEVTYTVPELLVKMRTVRKGFHLYYRQYNVYRAIEESTLRFLDGDNIFEFELYAGQPVKGKPSVLSKIIPTLDKWLNKKGYNIPGNWIGNLFRGRVNKITFAFSSTYELERMLIYTDECGEKAITFSAGKKLKTLINTEPFNDPTAMAYLAKIEEMEQDLTARVPKPWLQFIKEHTYPELYDTTNVAFANTDPETGIASCVADALLSEGKQLGQDLLDSVFSLGDIIAWQFNLNLCLKDPEEVRAKNVKAGTQWDPNQGKNRTVMAMAKEQAFQTLQEDEQVFINFCALILGMGGSWPGSTGDAKTPREIWDMSFDKLKLCGLSTFLLDVLDCLFKGVTLEEALGSIIKNAFKAMSINNLGDLVIGLPYDKQLEIEALINKKLASGDIFKEGSKVDEAASAIDGSVNISYRPWEDTDITEEEKANSTTNSLNSPTDEQTRSNAEKKTLNQQLQLAKTAKQKLSPNVMMEAWILAIIEVYNDDLLSLVDELNKFPGAQLIKTILASLDCPRPPLFEPGIFDFIKSIELPFCRGMDEITLPRLQNPGEWLPKWTDFPGVIFEALKNALNELIMSILIKLMIRICQLLGNSICTMIAIGGDLVESLPPAGCDNKFSDLIKESICGVDASSEVVDNTIVDTFALLGAGGAALANQEQVIAFAEDISCAVTRGELINAFLGNASPEILDVIDSLVEYDHPYLRAGLRNKESIGNFFTNVGNLMPSSFRSQLEVVGDLDLPANPSLCATPQQLETFYEMRKELLGDRASPLQKEKVNDDFKNKIINDLEEIGDILQSGLPQYIADNMPPLVSDPNCDNGMIPYEAPQTIKATTSTIGSALEQLKVDFATDMLGNGPGEQNWGLMNMILSDTYGKPLSAHHRKTSNKRNYVDFYIDPGADDEDQDKETPNVAALKKQKGAYPATVAQWLQNDLDSLSSTFTFSSTNNWQPSSEQYATFENLGVGLYGAANLNYIGLPDYGYNVDTTVDIQSKQVVFTLLGRKSTPDTTLEFRDNAKGTGEEGAGVYSYGFNLELFLSDLVENSEGTIYNLPTDNARIKITNLYNSDTNLNNTEEFYSETTPDPNTNSDPQIIEDLYIEFLASDNILSQYDMTQYPKYAESWISQQTYAPQVILLGEIINQKNGTDYASSDIKPMYDEIMSTVMKAFLSSVSSNDMTFLYGAKFDPLAFEDAEYLTPDGAPYFESELTNADAVLGISRNQQDNPDDPRIIYLDPTIYGGNYMNPPVYVKPLENNGWLGFLELMFPEASPCKPHSTDLVDFGSIQDLIDESYPKIPEDERLKSDPDCIREAPYERILERPSAAGIEGIIHAAARIYSSVHFIKSLASFATFNPDFENVFSNIYVSYIVEDMEAGFKSAQKAGWEFFNPFKDEEFWYAFLEQSVQLYNRKIEEGAITTVPSDVQAALEYLAEVTKAYHYPNKEDMKGERDLGAALAASAIGGVTMGVAAAAAGPLGAAAAGIGATAKVISLYKTLKEYREEQKYEFLKQTEEYAKVILKEIVKEELTFMADIFLQNMGRIGLSPTFTNLNYYLLTHLSQGALDLDLHKEIKEEVTGLPTEGDNLYTSGGELVTAAGEDYIGYYHVYIDEEGTAQYMEGEFHISEEGDVLTVVSAFMTVPIGDIAEYGDSYSSSAEKPFIIEKYISINGVKMNPTEALTQIRNNDGELLISEVYPGTLEQVINEAGQVVGLEGELGVRYGLQLSILVNGNKEILTTAEIDALDLPVSLVQPFDGNSKLLLCLINLLVNDETFTLLTKYIFAFSKMVSVVAIYNDMAFLPSIGQLAPSERRESSTSINEIPGMHLTEGDTGLEPAPVDDTVPGWANYYDRSSGASITPFVLEFDDWDQVLLRNSKSRIKRIFKTYYNSRDFDPGDGLEESPASLAVHNFRQSLKMPSGHKIFPWWRRRMLRTNPFNADGVLCKKKN